MCNILQSIPTQLNNLAMQLQTSWGVGQLSSTIQCYMDLSRALYFLSCHGYGHMLAVRLISVPLQCGIAVLLSMEPTAHRDNDSIFVVGVDRCFLAPSTGCTSAFHDLLPCTTSSVPNDAGENMSHALPKPGSHQPNPPQTATFQSQNPAEPDSRRSMFKSVQCHPDRMRLNCDYVWRVVVSISKCFCEICGWGDKLHQ